VNIMNENLKVVGVQAELAWHDARANHNYFAELLGEAPGADIYVLPEMFSTGFSMETKSLAEPMDGPTHQWMVKTAKWKKAVICGSVIIVEKGHYYNRFIWVDSSGKTQFYDKRHRFTMAGEHEHFNAGNEQVIVEINGWKIMLQVCYDLRFPVWSRNTQNYDAVIYVANWPAPRTSAWSKLLLARAIENQCYVVGVNRVGVDGNDIDYTGASVIVDPKGDVISDLDDGKEGFVDAVFYKEELERFRKKFPVLEDRDSFVIKIDPNN